MDTMEHYSYSTAQSPSPQPLPPPYIPLSGNNDMPLHLIYAMDDLVVYPTGNLNTTFPDATICLSPTIVDSDSRTETGSHDFTSKQINLKNGRGRYQSVARSSTFPDPTRSSPVTSPEVDSDFSVHEHSSISSHHPNPTNQSDKIKKVKRRMQNRAAQRRFRERKEEEQKNLQQKAADLQEKYQALSDKFNQKSDEVSELLKENDGLKDEVQSLRKRWRTMIALLQRPKSLQSLSVLLAGEEPPSNSQNCSYPGPGTDHLEEYLQCLDALLIPNDRLQ